MEAASPRDLVAQRYPQVFRQHGDAILRTFAFGNDDLAPLEIAALDAESQAFEQAHARAVDRWAS